MVYYTDEGSMSLADLENVSDGIANFASTDSENVEGSNYSVRQNDLAIQRKSIGDMEGVKPLNSRQSRAAKQLQCLLWK